MKLPKDRSGYRGRHVVRGLRTHNLKCSHTLLLCAPERLRLTYIIKLYRASRGGLMSRFDHILHASPVARRQRQAIAELNGAGSNSITGSRVGLTFSSSQKNGQKGVVARVYICGPFFATAILSRQMEFMAGPSNMSVLKSTAYQSRRQPALASTSLTNRMLNDYR